MNPLLVVGGIILNEAGQILLAQRPQGKRLAGFWEFPGGKVEDGESLDSALQRELMEELNLKVEVLDDIGRFTHAYEWGVIELQVFAVRALNTPSLTPDVQAIRWLNPTEIETATLAPADLPALNEYRRRISSTGPLVR